MKDLSYNLRKVSVEIDNVSKNIIEDHDLTIQQYMIIKFLSDYNKPINQATIADFFNKTPATLTSTLKIMDKQGYITRTIDMDNERQKLVSLTDKSISMLEHTSHNYDKVEKIIDNSLTSTEMDNLIMLLDKLQKNIKDGIDNE